MVVPYYTDESRVTLSPDTLQAMDLKRVYREAMRIEFEKGCTTLEWAEGAGLRAVYELGRQHGAAANSKPTPNFAQIRSSAPAGGLVERVADAIYRNGIGDGFRKEARAAICEVADWLDHQQEVPIGCSTASADYFSDMLREEVNQ